MAAFAGQQGARIGDGLQPHGHVDGMARGRFAADHHGHAGVQAHADSEVQSVDLLDGGCAAAAERQQLLGRHAGLAGIGVAGVRVAEEHQHAVAQRARQHASAPGGNVGEQREFLALQQFDVFDVQPLRGLACGACRAVHAVDVAARPQGDAAAQHGELAHFGEHACGGHGACQVRLLHLGGGGQLAHQIVQPHAHEVPEQGRRRVAALRRPLLERLAQQGGDGVGGDGRRQLHFLRAELAVHDLGHRGALHGGRARQAFEEHQPPGIQVGAGAGRLAAQLLGRAVGRRAQALVAHGELRDLRAGKLRNDGADAEVQHHGVPHGARGGDHHVVGLEVAVHDAGGMRAVQRIEHLGHEAAGLGGSQHALAADQALEGLAGHIFEDAVDAVALLALVQQLDDVRMVQGRAQHGLAVEALHLAAAFLQPDDLDGHRCTRAPVARAVDGAVATRSQGFQQFVIGYFQGGWRHRGHRSLRGVGDGIVHFSLGWGSSWRVSSRPFVIRQTVL